MVIVPGARKAPEQGRRVEKTEPQSGSNTEVKTPPPKPPEKSTPPVEKPAAKEEGEKVLPQAPAEPVKPQEKPDVKDVVKKEPPNTTLKSSESKEKPDLKKDLTTSLPAEGSPPANKPQGKPVEKQETKSTPKSVSMEEPKDKVPKIEKKDNDEFKSREHLRKLREEAQSELKVSDSGVPEKKGEDAGINVPPVDELEKMNVHQLRRLARSIPSFPIKGRDISIANRGTLLDYLKKL